MKFTNNDIARHFEYCEDHYRLFWKLEKNKSMHYGYWDENIRNLNQALMKINQVMAEMAGITTNCKVLDAGCGLGGSSVWLGEMIGCKVAGITVSEKQMNQANTSASKKGISDKVQFFQQDYCNTKFPDASFDVVWGIESVCYAENKEVFMREAFRLLKPGGRMIIADFFKKEELMGKEKEMIDKMAYGWAIADFATIQDFESGAIKAGFSKTTKENISVAITPSARRIYYASFLGLIGTKLYGLFFKQTELTKYHARTSYIQYKALKKGLWDYYLFIAEK